MKTLHTIAGAVALILLLASVVKADEPHKPLSSFWSIMLGASLRDDSDHAARGECMFVNGSMMNRYVGFQMEFDGTNYSGNSDAESGDFYALAAALKLALPVAFVEPYLLGGAGVGLGAPGASEHTSFGFPVHAAAGIDLHFGKVLVGMEARQVWLAVEHVNFDSLVVMTKFGFRY